MPTARKALRANGIGLIIPKDVVPHIKRTVPGASNLLAAVLRSFDKRRATDQATQPTRWLKNSWELHGAQRVSRLDVPLFEMRWIAAVFGRRLKLKLTQCPLSWWLQVPYSWGSRRVAKRERTYFITAPSPDAPASAVQRQVLVKGTASSPSPVHAQRRASLR
jgi:hypothetical protein